MPCYWRNERCKSYKSAWLVDDDGVRRKAIVLPAATIQNILAKPESLRPATQDDWKYFLHLFGGPKPSLVESLEIKPIVGQRPTCMALIWKFKGEI